MTDHDARSVSPIDAYVGREIAVRRKARGLSQTDLARATGVSFQQMQKYENGQNRISASRLYAIASALDVELAAFFPPAASVASSSAVTPAPAPNDAERAAVAADWGRIRNRGDRQAAARVIRALALA